VILAYIAIGWFCSLAYLIYLKHENAKRAAGLRDEVIDGEDNKRGNAAINGQYASVGEARRDKGSSS
jgi:hypothetical protein